MNKRVWGVAVCILAFALFSSTPAARADEPVATDSARSERVDAAIAKGIQFLLNEQNEEGWFSGGAGRKQKHVETTMTALALMAFASAGHQPTDPDKEGEAMRKALAFVLRDDRQTGNGYFGERDGSRMYGHGIITLMLGEMIGMGAEAEQDKLIRLRLQKAVDLILRSQRINRDESQKGGWRYTPDDAQADLSATIWQVMALRAAKNAGMDVPKEAIDSAIRYVRRCYQSERDSTGKPKDLKSGFCYQPGAGVKFSTTSAGLLAMQVCSQYDAPEVIGATEWLHTNPPTWNTDWFFYGTHYYAHGMYRRGGSYGDEARRIVEKNVLEHQNPDGSWEGNGQERDAGKTYCTSLAILSLAVKNHFLPIYQR